MRTNYAWPADTTFATTTMYAITQSCYATHGDSPQTANTASHPHFWAHVTTSLLKQSKCVCFVIVYIQCTYNIYKNTARQIHFRCCQIVNSKFFPNNINFKCTLVCLCVCVCICVWPCKLFKSVKFKFEQLKLKLLLKWRHNCSKLPCGRHHCHCHCQRCGLSKRWSCALKTIGNQFVCMFNKRFILFSFNLQIELHTENIYNCRGHMRLPTMALAL